MEPDNGFLRAPRSGATGVRSTPNPVTPTKLGTKIASLARQGEAVLLRVQGGQMEPDKTDSSERDAGARQ
jgi:hypothetical protein